MSDRIVAGIGFRRSTGAEEIAALIARALGAIGAARADLTAIATATDRAAEPSICQAASEFGLTPCPVEPAALEACNPKIVTRSARIERLRGVGSLAETAALAAAGPESRLALPRIASDGATCALAIPHHTARHT